MTFTVSPWLVWAGLCLALFGVVWVWQVARAAARDAWKWLRDRPPPPLMILRVWAWLRRDRVIPLLKDPSQGPHEDGCWCHECKPLPPERTWEQMTSHQLPIVGMSPAERKDWQRREQGRKRQAKRVEMTYRAHYVAMGFDYPSGLMARVREAAQ